MVTITTPTDLYKTYKLIKQRASRSRQNAPGSRQDLNKQEMERLAKQIIDSNESVETKIALSDQIYQIEKRTLGCQTKFSLRIKRALESNNYVINIPYNLRHAKEESPSNRGFIYIADAPSRPGQSKFGSTTQTLRKRLNLYTSRYGYYVRPHWHKYVNMPHSLEEQIKKKLVQYRVAGLTKGDSNEWYRLPPEKLQERVEEIIKNLS